MEPMGTWQNTGFYRAREPPPHMFLHSIASFRFLQGLGSGPSYGIANNFNGFCRARSLESKMLRQTINLQTKGFCRGPNLDH